MVPRERRGRRTPPRTATLVAPLPASAASPPDKNGGKRLRASGDAGSSEEEDHQARQQARRTDPTNPFRVGDLLNPHAVKYKNMCEKRHNDQVVENGHAAAAIQIALDNGFHPDRTPFEAQPDEGEVDDAIRDAIDDAEGGNSGSPSTEATRLKSQRLARAATASRRSASAVLVSAPVAGAGPATGVDVFDVDAMDLVDATPPPTALPPPLGKSRAKSTPKSNKSGLINDVLTAEEKNDIRKIHEVFGDSTILLKVAPSSYDIDGRGPQWALANVSREQAADWGSYEDPHFLIVVPGPPMNDEMRAATAAALQAILESAAPSEAKKTQPQVASANAEDPALTLLNIFFVFSITAAVRDGFRVSTGFCAGRDNQLIFTFDLNSRASSFIYTMFGITLKDPEEDAEQVGGLVTTTLGRTKEVRALIIKIKPSLSPALMQMSDDGLVDYFLDSVRVSGMRMVSPTKRGVWITQWNVYMDHAYLFQGQHRALRSTFASVPIVTSFFGTGRMIKKHWYCASCMSISHPTGLCPFTALPGWAATMAAAADPPDDISDRLGEAAEGGNGGRGGLRGGRGGFRSGKVFRGGRGGRGGKF